MRLSQPRSAEVGTGSVLGFGVSAAEPTRLLVGGVGYSYLSDLSFGPRLIERLQGREWPRGACVEDLSYSPIDVLFRLQASPPFAAAVLCGAVGRGRDPGSLHSRRWTSPPRDEDSVQAAIGEALTGVISLDNLLAILDHFHALPARVTVVELEPCRESWGDDMSGGAERSLRRAESLVAELVGEVLAIATPV